MIIKCSELNREERRVEKRRIMEEKRGVNEKEIIMKGEEQEQQIC